MAPSIVNIAGPSVLENVAIGSWVYTVNVVDENREDWTYGDTITYSLTHALFDIDTETGEVTTTGALDYETTVTHSLTVSVSDGAHTDTDTFVVTVINVNEDVFITNLPATDFISAPATTANQLIRTITYSSDYSGNLRCILVKQDPIGTDFYMTGCSVYLTASLSATQTSKFTVSVVVADADGTYTSDVHNLTVRVTDLQMSPSFTNMPAVLTLHEDVTGVNALYSIGTVDPEGDTVTINWLSTQTLPDGSELLFTFTANTLYTASTATFDYEGDPLAYMGQSYTLFFEVTDGFTASRSSSIVIQVVDMGETPVCSPSTLSATINEGLPVGTRIPDITLSVTDGDSGDTGHRYVIQDDDGMTYTGADYFVMDGNVLTVARVISLDVSGTTSHTLRITAVDKDSLTCDFTVTITVLDINDPHYVTNLPATVILDATAVIAEDIIFTAIVDPVEASDTITWVMGVPNVIDGLFELEEQTGDVKCKTTLATIFPAPMYTIPITAYDQDGNSDGPYILTINITETKQPPYVSNLPTTINIEENSVVLVAYSSVIYSVTGSDTDGDPITSYEIVNVYPSYLSGRFAISGSGGIQSTSSYNYDFETTNEIVLECRVHDSFHISDPKNLTIKVSDVNEPPVFTSTSYAITIPEELAVGTLLDLSPHNLAAVDPDKGDTLTYQLASAIGEEYFTITDNKLEVVARIDTDGGFTSPIVLDVSVMDTASLSDSATITVSVYDINDNDPIFPSSTYHATVKENTWGSTVVFDLTATDADIGVNSQIKYSIENVGDSFGSTYFQVDEDDGMVRTKYQPDFDLDPNGVFVVLAIDGGTPALTGTATVSIKVENVNDNTPWFRPDFFNIDFPCNENIGNELITAHAEDADNGNLTYEYLRLNRYYNLDSDTGLVSVSEKLRCNVKNMVYLLAKENDTLEGTSNVCIVRVNQFDPWDYLVDIHLGLSPSEFTDLQSNFTHDLDEIVEPHKITIYNINSNVGSGPAIATRRKLLAADDLTTIVTLYVTFDSKTFDVENIEMDREFVHKNEFLPLLRKSIMGTPTDILQSSEFAKYSVSEVQPAYQNWWLDTPGGIATTAILSLLLLILVALLFYFCCCRKRKNEDGKEKKWWRPWLSPSQGQEWEKFKDSPPTKRSDKLDSKEVKKANTEKAINANDNHSNGNQINENEANMTAIDQKKDTNLTSNAPAQNKMVTYHRSDSEVYRTVSPTDVEVDGSGSFEFHHRNNLMRVSSTEKMVPSQTRTKPLHMNVGEVSLEDAGRVDSKSWRAGRNIKPPRSY